MLCMIAGSTGTTVIASTMMTVIVLIPFTPAMADRCSNLIGHEVRTAGTVDGGILMT